MDIEDAFTTEAIESMDDGIGAKVIEVIGRIAEENSFELTNNELNFAGLCFMAGRAYQDDQPLTISVDMTLDEYVTYLKGARDERSGG